MIRFENSFVYTLPGAFAISRLRLIKFMIALLAVPDPTIDLI
jgi:hypothetical protein